MSLNARSPFTTRAAVGKNPQGAGARAAAVNGGRVRTTRQPATRKDHEASMSPTITDRQAVVTAATPPWKSRAACRGLSSEVFYPADDDAVATAKSICASCRVAPDCLEHAIAVREKDGIWGGATERERRSIVRRRRRAAAKERARELEGRPAEVIVEAQAGGAAGG